LKSFINPALVGNNLGKECSPVTSRAESETSFSSAFPNPMQEKGKEKEMDGGGDQLADIVK
jgi:hypothetical protein